jgi:phosphoribosylanthranilate isomerase
MKICGITHRPDVFVATALGADAIGLNFYEPSPRYLPPSLAGNVAAAIPSGVAKVGVFVNAAVDEVIRLAERLRLDFIQLAGDEPPEFIAALDGRPVVKCFRIGADGIEPLRRFLDQAMHRRCMPTAVLLDACRPGQFGGTGTAMDWHKLRTELDRGEFKMPPVILAGGLTPDNVGESITTIRPDAVDVASGVEYAPGRKDALLVSRFLETASAAFARLPAK